MKNFLWALLALLFTSSHVMAQDFKCDIYLDKQDIYHVKASQDKNLWFCLGYLHAQDRLFQLEFLKMVAQGKAAEFFGHKWIRSDFFMRILDLESRAKEITKDLAQEHKKTLEGYANGVNQAIREGASAYQLEELEIKPSQWQAHQSVMLLLLQSLDQTKKTFTNEIQEQRLLEKYNIRFDPPPWETSILKKDEIPKLEGKEDNNNVTFYNTEIEDFFLEDLTILNAGGAGSNNWAISNEKSSTGHALLANDPHLSLKTPSFWYPIHLEGDKVSLFGMSIPGTPIIPTGNNKKLAWALTNAYVDVGELFMIPASELDNWEQEYPIIWFKFGPIKLPFFFKSFKKPKGNLIALPFDAPKNKAYVVRWTTLDLKAKGLAPVFEFFKQKNVVSFNENLAKLELPTWNYVFADTEGNIGYHSVGKLPKRSHRRKVGITSSDIKSIVKNYSLLKGHEEPQVINPKSGHVITANNKHVPDNEHYSTGNAYSSGQRAHRIEKLIQQRKLHDHKSIKEIQCDTFNNEAFFILPELLKLLAPSKEKTLLSYLYNEFKNWDYKNDLDCRICAVYRLWVDKILAEFNLRKAPRFEDVLWEWIKKHGAANREKITNALFESYYILTKKHNGELPLWGQVYLTEFPSQAGDDFFQHKLKIPAPGAGSAVNNLRGKWNDQKGHFKINVGASTRIITELSDPPQIWSIYPGLRKDEPLKNMASQNSPWSKWSRCEYEKRYYPYDFPKEEKIKSL